MVTNMLISTKRCPIRKGRSAFDFRSKHGLSETGQYCLKTTTIKSHEPLLIVYKTNWSFWSNSSFDSTFYKEQSNVLTTIPLQNESELTAWDFFVRHKQEWLFICLKQDVMMFDIAKGVWYCNSQFAYNDNRPWAEICISPCGNVMAAKVENEQGNRWFLEFFDFSDPSNGWSLIRNPNVCPTTLHFKFRWTVDNTIICDRFLIAIAKTDSHSDFYKVYVQTIEVKIVPRYSYGFKICLEHIYDKPSDSDTLSYRNMKGMELHFPQLM